MQARHSGEPVAADWDRAHWISYADRLLAGAMALATPDHARITLPGVAGGYGRAVDRATRRDPARLRLRVSGWALSAAWPSRGAYGTTAEVVGGTRRSRLTAVLRWPDGAATMSRLPESPIVPFESVMSAGPVTDPEQV